jgi:hypothetical protein
MIRDDEQINRIERKAVKHILDQVRADKSALDSLGKVERAVGSSSIDWYRRTEEMARSLVMDLVKSAPELVKHVENTLNSPQNVREAWGKVKAYLLTTSLPPTIKKLIRAIDAQLFREAALLKLITGEMVSALIADFLCAERSDLLKNSRSNYPDLFSDSADYTLLPQRKQVKEDEGPATREKTDKGKPRPTNVPDGLEIKSNVGASIRVDCHHPHQGLHLVLTFNNVAGRWVVHDLWIAYLSEADYRESGRKSRATTVKYSFGHAPFISILRGNITRAKLVVEHEADFAVSKDTEQISLYAEDQEDTDGT